MAEGREGHVTVEPLDGKSRNHGSCYCCSYTVQHKVLFKINCNSIIGQGWITTLCGHHLKELFEGARSLGWKENQ